MRVYVKQFIATVVPAGFSVEQVLNGGNILLATVAALLAVLAGRWALRKQRLDAETAELNKQIAEQQLAKLLDDAQSRPPFETKDDAADQPPPIDSP